MSETSIPIIGAISLQLARTNEGYQVKILEHDTTVYVETCKTAPWNSPKIQANIIAASHKLLNPETRPEKDIYQTKFRNVCVSLYEELEQNPEQKRALTSPVVTRIIKETEWVRFYFGEHTMTEVCISGKILPFTSGEMASRNPTSLNTKWWNAFAERLRATRIDWEEIGNYWEKIGQKIAQDPETEIGILIESLGDYLAGNTQIYSDPDLVSDPKHGYYDAAKKMVLIPSTLIRDFLREQNADRLRENLAKELLKKGCLLGPSIQKRFRHVASKKRYWQFSKDFVDFLIDETGRPTEIKEIIFTREVVSHGTG